MPARLQLSIFGLIVRPLIMITGSTGGTTGVKADYFKRMTLMDRCADKCLEMIDATLDDRLESSEELGRQLPR